MFYMDESVKDRLIKFIAYKGLSQGKFEKMCGMGNGYVNNIRSSIQPDKLQRIFRCFPDLNIGWLMLGEEYGEPMVRQDNSQRNSPIVPGVNVENVHAVFITNWQDIAGAVAEEMRKHQ